MTEAQKEWLAANPRYAPVRERLVSIKGWTDEGYLWPNGKFSRDDGKTLFWHPYKAGAVRVGREYEMV